MLEGLSLRTQTMYVLESPASNDLGPSSLALDDLERINWNRDIQSYLYLAYLIANGALAGSNIIIMKSC